jgi:bifunctional DNA-binding transcriptional regulator/antitoxin component of YhaV-PrlF toxin-antitoxin module
VAADAPVITIPGVCNPHAAATANSADCKLVVTRAEFEKLMKTVAPTAPAFAKRQIASRYAVILVMSNEAEKLGLDKGEQFDEMMKLSRMQVLAQQLQKNLQEKADAIPVPEEQNYYNQHRADYEEASLQRLFIPKSKQLEPSKQAMSEADSQKEQQDAEAAMKTEADALQKRAAAGEEFAKLQDEAFQFAGLKAKAPDTHVPNARRTTLPATQRQVFDLQAGQVSPLIPDNAGYFVYKMGDKQTLPLDKVKEEIHATLRGERLQAETKKLEESAKPSLNDQYFGPAPAAAGPQTGMKAVPKPQTPEPKSN